MTSRTYERNSCFYLWLYRDGKNPELQPYPVQQLLLMPISGKKYKTTLKNLKVFVTELLQFDQTITKIELERASNIGTFRRKESNE